MSKHLFILFSSETCHSCYGAFDKLNEMTDKYNIIPVIMQTKFIRNQIINSEANNYYNKFNLEYRPMAIIDMQEPGILLPDWETSLIDNISDDNCTNITWDIEVTDTTVNIQISSGEIHNDYKLIIWIIEDNVTINQYTFPYYKTIKLNDIFRKSVTSNLMGDDIIINKENNSYSYNYKIDSEWNKNNLSIVAFIYNKAGIQLLEKIKINGEF